MKNHSKLSLALLATAVAPLVAPCMSAPESAVEESSVPRVASAKPELAAGRMLSERQMQTVFKIFVTRQRPDYAQPWQSVAPSSANGSGFLISGKRLMTNAHVVSDATFVEVQQHGDSRKYPSKVVFSGHDCDLAVIEITEDGGLLDDLEPIAMSDSIPKLGDEIHAVGFPMGGMMLSLTRGVVSRIDMGNYAHSGVDSHLIIQTDAAINPGNSGGPVVLNDRIVGVAFQGMTGGQNIGYVIPMPVVRHFLDDISDGVYHGYPELGVRTIDSRNPALRAALRLTDDSRGAVVTYVDPLGAAAGRLFPADAILSVDNHIVAPDATVKFGQSSLNFTEIIERKQWGQKMEFEVWRKGKTVKVSFPLDAPHDPFVLRNEYDVLPEYVLAGGLLFEPVTRGFLRTLDGIDTKVTQPLFYYSVRAKFDGLVGDRRQFVVLGDRLPHAWNAYSDSFLNRLVSVVNGVKINELSDIKRGLQSPRDGFHVIEFIDYPLPLVLDATKQAEADADIARSYNVTRMEYLRPKGSGGAGQVESGAGVGGASSSESEAKGGA